MESIIKRLAASDVGALPDAASGVTAGSYGPSSDTTGSSVSVPQITVDSRGRVTRVINRTFTALSNIFSSNQTLGPSSNISAPSNLTVPYFTVNRQGVVTAVANRTYTTPVASSSSAGLMSAADKAKSDAASTIYRKMIQVGNIDKVYINMGITSGRQTFFVWSAWNGAALNGVVSATIGGQTRHTLVNSYHVDSGTGRIAVTLSGRKICIDVGGVPCYDYVIVESIQDFTLSVS